MDRPPLADGGLTVPEIFLYALLGFVALVVLLVVVLLLRGWRAKKGGPPSSGFGDSGSSMSGWGS